MGKPWSWPKLWVGNPRSAPFIFSRKTHQRHRRSCSSSVSTGGHRLTLMRTAIPGDSEPCWTNSWAVTASMTTLRLELFLRFPLKVVPCDWLIDPLVDCVLPLTSCLLKAAVMVTSTSSLHFSLPSITLPFRLPLSCILLKRLMRHFSKHFSNALTF